MTNLYYWPTFITSLLRLFSFYYLHRVSFHYEPRVSTSSQYAFVLASVQDPEWFESHGLLIGGAAVPTEAALVSRPGSCTSNGWAPCSINQSVDTKIKYFCAGTSTTTSLDFSTEPAAGIRQSVAGITAISSAVTGSVSTDTIIGDFYADVDMEMCELSIAQTVQVQLDRSDLPVREQKKNEPVRRF